MMFKNIQVFEQVTGNKARISRFTKTKMDHFSRERTKLMRLQNSYFTTLLVFSNATSHDHQCKDFFIQLGRIKRVCFRCYSLFFASKIMDNIGSQI